MGLNFVRAALSTLLFATAPMCLAASGVLQHHNDAGRDGHYVVPGLTYARAAHLHPVAGFDARVPGAINAQPLYWRGTDGRALIIVATEQNVVAALNADSGKTVWRRTLGPPVPGSKLPCGNISPLGITGTPVISAARAAIYLDAMVLADGEPRHEVFGLSLKEGAILPGWPVDVQRALAAAGRAFAARVQNQRGALAILNGKLYVPFGGHFGDCGKYRGWVVGLPLDRPESVLAFATRAYGGGIWAPGGIAVADGELFVSTGNTFGAREWADGEAVLRLPPSLRFRQTHRGFFAPKNWAALDAQDLDLGGTNPVPLNIPKAKPSHLILALGKDGKAYLLNRENLGGIGGALRVVRVANGAIRTAPAAYTAKGRVFVAFQGSAKGCPSGQRGDLAALRIIPATPPSLGVAWCAEAHGRGSPMVTTDKNGTNPIVWIVGAEGDDRLRGFRGDTGKVVFDGKGTAMRTVSHFQTPIAAGGRIYVAANNRVYAFAF